MSRTHHHKARRHQNHGYGYRGKLLCNKGFSPYGSEGRSKAHNEMRSDTKSIVRSEINQYPEEKVLDEVDYAYYMYYHC